MKGYYSIGEVSRITGLSTQTLRYYDSIDLLKPEYTNEATGYRYYTFNQFHFIDRIKYLQKLGMSLDDIKGILVNNDIRMLIDRLNTLEEDCKRQIAELTDTMDTIDWYRQYFSFSQKSNQDPLAYIKHFPERYLVAVDIRPGDSKADFHIRLTKLRNSEKMKSLTYKRQYSLILDYDAMIRHELKEKSLGMLIKGKPSFESEDIIRIPEGDYYCFKSQILKNDWNPQLINLFFQGKDSRQRLVVADEYENSLKEYDNCPYEVQILI